MNTFNDPAYIEWFSALALSIGVSLIVAGILALWSGRLLDIAPEHKLWVFIVGFAFLCSLSSVPMSQHGTWEEMFYKALLPLLIIFIYFLPTAAAINAHHPNFNGLFIMNLLFGWTVAGWIVALFWALRRPGLIESADFRVTPFGAVPPNRPRDQPH